MSLKAKRDRRERLRRERDALEAEITKQIGRADVLEASIESKRDRHPDSPRRAAELRDEIFEMVAELEALREDERDAQGRLRRTKHLIAKLGRQIKNAAKPTVIDLGSDLDFGPMTSQGAIIGSIGHYTAGPQETSTENAVALWKGVHAAHKAQGWAGIGYQIGITIEGAIVLLRPRNVVGAHTEGHNTGQIGFSAHGTTGDRPTPLQARALRVALKRYGLDAKPVTGHNDWMPTGCPGLFKPMYLSKGKTV